jgi:myosin-crossreactive antigen
VPELLKGYNAILKHLYLTKYKQAMLKEFNGLIDYKTFKYKEYSDNEKLVLLIWVYINKFDEDGFLTNFKARLIARGDLYKTEEETYTIILVA